MNEPTAPQPKTLPGSWELVQPSIRLLRQNFDTLLWLVLIPAALGLLASQLLSNMMVKYADRLAGSPSDAEIHSVLHDIGHELFTTTHGHVLIGLFVAGLLWQLLIYPATISFMLRAAKGESADIRSSLKGGFGYFWRTYGITICSMLLVFAGLIFFIVPGFIFLRRYMLAVFYGMDNKSGVFEAMRLSAKDSVQYKGYIWGTLGVFFAFILMGSAVGSIPLIGVAIGLVVNYLYYFGFALRYVTMTRGGKPLPGTEE